jgi:hypothetical protein
MKELIKRFWYASRFWYVFGLVSGGLIVCWGVARQWINPAPAFNIGTFAFVFAGGFIMFMAWFSHTFND